MTPAPRGGHPGLLLAGLLLLIPALPVSAAQRYAAPDGSGTACTSGAPCDVRTAIESAAANDEIVIAPGDYALAAEIDNANGTPLDIHGTDGAERPRLLFSSAAGLVILDGATSVRHLYVEALGDGTSAFALAFGGTADDVVVHATGTGFAPAACFARSATLRNCVCWASGDYGRAFVVQGNTTDTTVAVRNTTLVAPGTGSVAVRAESYSGHAVVVNLVNTIARGGAGGTDIAAQTDSSASASATVYPSYSNYGSASAQGTGADVWPGSGNQTAAPAFLDATSGDFHQASGSPTIDAGLDDSANGTTDIDGDTRAIGTATDIGADEFVPLPPPPTPQPTVLSFAVTNAVFKVARTEAAPPRPRRGTTFQYALSDAADVVIQLDRMQRGRLREGTCVRPSRTPRGARCTRYTAAGTLAATAVAGANEQAFSGRIAGRPLKPGRYRATLTATNAGGTSDPASASFRVVRR